MQPILVPGKLKQFAEAVRRRMAEMGLRRKSLANSVGVGDGVIGKVLAAKPVHNANFMAIAQFLNIDLDNAKPATSNEGYLSIGAYSYDAVKSYEGQFLTIRPVFSDPHQIKCFCTKIAWNEKEKHLGFIESKRSDVDHAQSGKVFIPSGGAFIHLVSGSRGWVRSVTLSPLSVRMDMRGVVSTLANISGPLYLPVAAPIIYQKMIHIPDSKLGVFTKKDQCFEGLVLALRETTTSYIKLVAPG